MGVPTFYRWLCNRYPRVPKDVIDTYSDRYIDTTNEEVIGVELLSPNPNGEFDNLYLDMNGIIHPCCHPENIEQPSSEEIMFQCIFDYIDRIFFLIRPRKLIFLAIDGVAPRAKMNQQRSRRFKSAADADLEDETYNKVLEEFKNRNIEVPTRKNRWDSNVITPGTPFMYELSKRIVEYIKKRIEMYDAWRRITVIFSDANVPGEGEHKIMNFIRNQRHCTNYNPNMVHVLHGMDADLIMLGLATHEINFYIIREIVTNFIDFKPEKDPLIITHEIKSINNNQRQSSSSYLSLMRESWKPLQFLQLPILREYLSHQLYFPNGWISEGGAIDFERCIDDLVLMCFFCGNDFLPNLPSVSITGGSIDQMILLYQKLLPELGDYLSNEGELNIKPLGTFVSYLGKIEDQIFKQAIEHKERCKKKQQNDNKRQRIDDYNDVSKKHIPNYALNNEDLIKGCLIYKTTKSVDVPSLNITSSAPLPTDIQSNSVPLASTVGPADSSPLEVQSTSLRPAVSSSNSLPVNGNATPGDRGDGGCVDGMKSSTGPQVDPAADLREAEGQLNKESSLQEEVKVVTSGGDNDRISIRETSDDEVMIEFKKRHVELLNEYRIVDDPKYPIDLSLNDPNLWKSNYYCEKFNISKDELDSFIMEISEHYIRGLLWVLKYYYQGCISWGWYYPYHYAPFCSDLNFDDDISLKFDLGIPFTPIQQLMSVMPVRSSHCLPIEFRDLMTNPSSPILDFYPLKFKEDPNGKRYKYQWVALLPFIDEYRLLNVLKPLEDKLNDIDKLRNCISKNILFTTNNNVLNTIIGHIEDYNNDYKYITFTNNKKHKSRLLYGTILPKPKLKIEDLMEDQRNKGFNCDVAKRMILNLLGNKYDNLNHKNFPYWNNNKDFQSNNKFYDFHQFHNNPNTFNQYRYKHNIKDIPPWHK